MNPDGTARILVCANQMDALQELRRVLAHGGREVDAHVAGAPEPASLGRYHLLVVDGGRAPAEALDLCRRLRGRLDDRFVPILYVTDDHGPAARLASFEVGADTYLLRPFASGELLAQVQALLRIKEATIGWPTRRRRSIASTSASSRLHQQIDQELQLAQRIQSSFLPQTLPDVPRTRFAVHYLLCGRVGGDFYDVFRLDENSVGLYVADAMGHGVPASLLTIFVKKGVRAKEVFGQHYRLVPPEEVLQRLNKELIDQQLSEYPFITMAYGLSTTRKARFASPGPAIPIRCIVPREGEPAFWRQEGMLLGVVDAAFPARTYTLKPGDKVLLYSDGIDTALFRGAPAGRGESARLCHAPSPFADPGVRGSSGPRPVRRRAARRPHLAGT